MASKKGEKEEEKLEELWVWKGGKWRDETTSVSQDKVRVAPLIESSLMVYRVLKFVAAISSQPRRFALSSTRLSGLAGLFSLFPDLLLPSPASILLPLI